MLAAGPAFADEPKNPRILPPHSEVTITYPDGKTGAFTVGIETELVFPRSVPEKWVGPVVLDKCAEAWMGTSKDLQVEQEKDEPAAWFEGVKWAGIGAAIVGAFYLGTRF